MEQKGSFKQYSMKLAPLIPRERYRTEMTLNFRRYDSHTKLNEVDLPQPDFPLDRGTPAFLTFYDKKSLKNDSKHFEKILAKRFENLERSDSKISLNLPKLQKKSFNFCGVCECKYECDYYKHISSSSHKEKFRNHQLLECLQKEAESLHEEFVKNKKEHIRLANLEAEEKENVSTAEKESVKIQIVIEEKENIPTNHSRNQGGLSKQKIEIRTAKKENEHIHKTTKKKVILPRMRFSESGALITEYDDGSYSSKTPEGRIMFLSQNSRFSIAQLEEKKINDEVKEKQYCFSIERTGHTSCGRLSYDRVRLTHHSMMTTNNEGTTHNLFEQGMINSQESISGQLPKRSLKRGYSMYSDSEKEILKRFKSAKITEYNHSNSLSQSQSQTQRTNTTSVIKVDLQTISKAKWENFKKSVAGFICDLKGRVNQFYDFWRKKEP